MLRNAVATDAPLDAADHAITAQIVGAIGSVATFRALLDRLPGTSPDTVAAVLAVLASDPIHQKAGRHLISDAQRDQAPAVIDQWAALPLPHPLDSEFRFKHDTARRLVRQLIAETRAGDEIVLVGAPTVALALVEQRTDRQIRFVGPPGCVTDALLAQTGNRIAFGVGDRGKAAAALLDPPWYDGDVAAMMATCAWSCRTGASVLLVHPLAGTRAGAGSDVDRYGKVAARLGLIADRACGDVRYVTPLFELAAMHRCGLGRLEEWRRGGLMRFRATESSWQAPLPIMPRAAIELTLAGVRIRLTDPFLSADASLTPIAASAVFPSVSARAPGRSAANLWTSGNRAYRVDGAAAHAALSKLASDAGLTECSTFRRTGESTRLKPFDLDLKLVDQLYELVDREHVCARQLVGDGAWLTSAQGWQS